MATPFNLVSFAALVLILGLASAGLTAVVRKFPWWPEKYSNVPPRSCPTCLNLWCSLVVVLTFTMVEKQVSLTAAGIFAFLVTWGASMAIAMHVTVAAGVFVDRDALAALGTLPTATPSAAPSAAPPAATPEDARPPDGQPPDSHTPS